ncbi:phage tail protein, partial [Aureibacter tunicatorum]
MNDSQIVKNKKRKHRASLQGELYDIEKQERLLADIELLKIGSDFSDTEDFQKTSSIEKPLTNSYPDSQVSSQIPNISNYDVDNGQLSQPSLHDAAFETIDEDKVGQNAPKKSSQGAIVPESSKNIHDLISHQITTASTQYAIHPSTQSSIDQGHKAAPVANQEVEGKAQEIKVDRLNQQEPEDFDAQSFKAQLTKRINAMKLPNNEEEAENFAENNNIEEVNMHAVQDVDAYKEASAKPISSVAEESPDLSSVQKRKVIALPKVPEVDKPVVSSESLIPKERPQQQVDKSLKAPSREMDQMLTSEGLNEQVLANSNEPEFMDALRQKENAHSHVDNSVDEYMRFEHDALNLARQDADHNISMGLTQMSVERESRLNTVRLDQSELASQDSSQRRYVGQQIEAYYNDTQTKVQGILSHLDDAVALKFKAGAQLARLAFEQHIEQKMTAYKNERYGESYMDIRQLRRVKDALVGLPDEVNEFFVTGRMVFVNTLDSTINDIALFVAAKLKEAKQIIKEGRQNISNYVDSLAPDLRKLGTQSALVIQSRFDSLQSSVDSKREELVITLADQYQQRVADMDKRMIDLKEKNKGVLLKAMDAMQGPIQRIREMRAMLMSLIDGMSEVVEAIILNPIAFFENLATGLGQGINAFLGNMPAHLKNAFFQWVTGVSSKLNIQLPENIFSVQGMLSIASQVLGFDWGNIRKIGAEEIGDKNVAMLEKSLDWFDIIRERGLGGLWEKLKDDLADFKAGVADTIKEAVLTQVIQAGFKWLLSLLSPAGALLKAAKAIIDVVGFFVDKAAQIGDLVQVFVTALSDIAKGKVSALASKVEEVMSRVLPLLIGVLASVLGINGLTKKVKGILESVRKKISDAIRKLWKKTRKLFGKKKGKKATAKKADKPTKTKQGEKTKGKEKDSRTNAEKQRDVKLATKEAIKLFDKKDTIKSFEKEIAFLKKKYSLKSIEVDKNPKNKKDKAIVARINPEHIVTLKDFKDNILLFMGAKDSYDWKEVKELEKKVRLEFEDPERYTLGFDIESINYIPKNKNNPDFWKFRFILLDKSDNSKKIADEIVTISRQKTTSSSGNTISKMLNEKIKKGNLNAEDKSLAQKTLDMYNSLVKLTYTEWSKDLNEVNKKWGEIQQNMQYFFGESNLASLPLPKFKFDNAGNRASKATVTYLSANRAAGTTPQVATEGWEFLQKAEMTNNSKEDYVRMHLINENFGGIGSFENLAPGTSDNNKNHLHTFE